MVETLSNKEKTIDKELLKIKRKIKWAFICFFSAWILLVSVLILGTIKSSTAITTFMKNFGGWFALLAFALFLVSIILMCMILRYLRKRKKETKMQIQRQA
jgi:hypothetical protein